MARVEPYVKVTEKIVDFPTLLSIDGSTNIGCVIVSEVGPKLAYIDGPNKFLKNYTKDGLTVPRNAHISFINAYYLSFTTGLVISRSMNADVNGGIAVYLDGEGALKYQATLYNGEVELKKKLVLGLTKAQSSTAWGIVINDILYYGGSLEAVYTGMLTNVPTVKTLPAVNIAAFGDGITDMIDLLCSELSADNTYVAIANNGGLTMYYDENTPTPYAFTTDAGVKTSIGTTTVFGLTLTPSSPAEAPIYSMEDTDVLLFEVISKTAGNVGSNPYSITVGANSTAGGNFELTVNGDKFVVSLNPDSVDSSGVNCFIEVLNTYNGLNFTVKDGGTGSLETQPTWAAGTATAYGAGFTNLADSSSTAYLKGAIDTLDDQELYRISGLATLGITNVQFVKTLVTLGEKRKWFTPWDIPYDRTNYSSISAYAANMPDGYNNYGIGPFDKNTGLTGWVNYIAPTTLYWERVMRNKAVNSEFAPVFDAETGIMAYTAPVKLLLKSTREKLLSLALPVNWVIFSENTGSYYMNDNFTHYSKADIMNEECNVRMAHKISNDLQVTMGQFKAKYNNTQTRNNVIDLINLYFQQNIMNQNFKPAEFMVICDESNNTPDIINAGKLAVTVKIRLYHSIKYIEVLNEIYSVGGQAFTA